MSGVSECEEDACSSNNTLCDAMREWSWAVSAPVVRREQAKEEARECMCVNDERSLLVIGR